MTVFKTLSELVYDCRRICTMQLTFTNSAVVSPPEMGASACMMAEMPVRFSVKDSISQWEFVSYLGELPYNRPLPDH